MDRLPREAAEKQISVLNDFYEVDINYLTPKVKEKVELFILQLTKHITFGRLTIESTGDGVRITQHLKNSPKIKKKDIVYEQYSSIVDKAIRRGRDEDSEAMTVVGTMSGEGADFFESSAMDQRDKAVAEALGVYFLLT